MAGRRRRRRRATKRPRAATSRSSETASVDVQNEPAPPAFGAVEVVKTDENGDPLAESCFSLTGAQNYGPICDNDGNDTNDAEGTWASPR